MIGRRTNCKQTKQKGKRNAKLEVEENGNEKNKSKREKNQQDDRRDVEEVEEVV